MSGSMVTAAVGATIGSSAVGVFGWSAATWTQIGWVAGSLLGNYLFSTETDVITEGPRLDNLHITISSFGAPINKVYGAYRIPGNIIWAQPLKETKHVERQSSGKGGGGSSSSNIWYSYNATFAVGLCEGPIYGIRKVWFGNSLVYDTSEGGDFDDFYASAELKDKFTIYNGTSNQDVDWLIEEDQPDTPAYRHLAYIVFNDISLKDYGNLIPNVTCEVLQDGETASKMLLSSDYIPHQTPEGTITVYNDKYMYSFKDVNAWSGSYLYQYYVYISTPSASAATLLRKVTASMENNNYPIFNNNIYTNTCDSVVRDVIRIFSDKPLLVKYWNDCRNNKYRFYLYDEEGTRYPPYLSDYSTVENDPIYPCGEGFYVDKTNFTVDNRTIAFAKDYNKLYIAHIRSYDAYPYIMRSDGDEFYHVIDPLELTSMYEIFVGDNEIYIIEATEASIYFTVKVYDIDGVFQKQLDITSAVQIAFSRTSGNFITRAYSPVDGTLYIIDGPSMHLHKIDTTLETYTFLESTTSIINTGYDNGGYIVKNDLLNQYVPGGIEKHQIVTYNAVVNTDTTISAIIEDLELESGLEFEDINNSAGDSAVIGYAITRNISAREAIEPVLNTFEYMLLEKGFKLELEKSDKEVSQSVIDEDFILNEYSSNIIQELDLMKSVTIKYANQESSYEISSQYAMRIDTSATNVSVKDIPIAITDTHAKQLAEKTLYKNWLTRRSYKLKLSIIYKDLNVGDVINIELNNFNQDVMITSITYADENSLDIEAVSYSNTVYVSSAIGTDTGGNGSHIVGDPGYTEFTTFNSPTLYNDHLNTGGVYTAASGLSDSWNGCNTLSKSNAQDDLTIDSTILGSTGLGYTGNTLGSHSPHVWDRINTSNVSSTIPLESASEADVISNGLNYIMIGDEILQYADVVENSGNYTISNLLRGRRGTEWAISTHSESERFIYFKKSAMSFKVEPTGSLNYYSAVSLGTIELEPIQELECLGTNLKPFSVSMLRYLRTNTTDINLYWRRRDRYITGYFNKLPLSESTEKYSVDVYYEGLFIKTYVRTVPYFYYTTALQTTDGITPGDKVDFYISQVSNTYGNGELVYLTVPDIDPVKDGLVMYLKLDNSTYTNGDTIIEEISANDGTYYDTWSGTTTADTSLVNIGGYSTNLNHNGNQRIEIPSLSEYSITNTGELGLSFYMKTDWAPAYPLIGKMDAYNGSDYEWKIYKSVTKLRVILYTQNGSIAREVEYSPGISNGVNYHVVVNFPDPSGTSDIKVYVNNVEYTPTSITTSGNSSAAGTGPITIGRRENSTLGGSIDDVRIYNKIISAPIRAALYAMKA